MPEKEPQVTFTDRRKISLDGEIRPEAKAEEEAKAREAQQRESTKATPPPPSSEGESNAAQHSMGSDSPGNAARVAQNAAGGSADQALPQGPTAQESAESNAAYQQTTQQLDELLRSKAPADSAHLGPVAFEHLVQSMYMTAMMGLGAGTKPGEKPRIDLMGARQTIDLLAVLQEKTKGNLDPEEQQLLESALFELRMTFLEITNAIARNAAAPGQPPSPGKK